MGVGPIDPIGRSYVGSLSNSVTIIVCCIDSLCKLRNLSMILRRIVLNVSATAPFGTHNIGTACTGLCH